MGTFGMLVGPGHWCTVTVDAEATCPLRNDGASWSRVEVEYARGLYRTRTDGGPWGEWSVAGAPPDAALEQLGPCPCLRRTTGNLGPCPRCGSIAAPFLGGYINLPPPPPEQPLPTVPWDPSADGHVPGKTVRMVRRAGEIAIENGWSAAQLRQRPNWNHDSVAAAAVRLAVRWGIIPE